MKDRLYGEPYELVADFVFDERVADVFPDMIQRSVPGYGTIINMIGTLAAQRLQPGSLCYDLGCSLGAASLAISRGAQGRDCRIMAVDNSPAMLRRARQLLMQTEVASNIQLICADLLDIHIRSAAMVVLNFTLQFIPLAHRRSLLQSIHQAMLPQGILILSEKIVLPSDEVQQLYTEMHHSFKRSQGYSELEISQKRSALEKVLLPETLATHKARLHEVGFATVAVWFQCFNFVSLLAIK